MIAFQIKGLINLFYILFCLWYIAKSANFVFQKNWSFPFYLEKLLKPVVMAELIVQFAFQVPFRQIHETDYQPETWQMVIGLVNIWKLNDDFLPEFMNVNTIIYKCLMFSFILIQQSIFHSEEYHGFTRKTLATIRSFSDRKSESMAYLHNNHKLKVTVKNQYEKDKMIKKLALVNRQVKKWNQTVFSKSSDRIKRKEEIKISSLQTKGNEQRIHEVGEHLEDEKLGTTNLKEIIKSEEEIEQAKKREKIIKKEKMWETLRKGDLIHCLVKDKIGLI